MNKNKIMGIIKTTKGKIALGVLGGIIIGSAIGGATQEEKDALAKNKDLNNQIVKLQEENTNLTKKVDEAKPFFEMEEDKRVAEAEKAKAEKEKVEKERAAEAEKAEKERVEKEKAEAAAALEAKTKVLGNGNFISGEDFEPGTYDIIAVSGGGNVSSSNMYSGGINAIMGSDAKIKESESIGMKDFYTKEYKNIKLPKGTSLKLDGVQVKLVPKG